LAGKNKLSDLKDSGAKHIAKGNWDKALEAYKGALELAPKDLRLGLKVGDCYRKIGENKMAIKYYDRIAQIYSKEGFVVNAIAVNKLILKLDKSFPGIEERLSTLYEEKVKGAEGPILKKKEGVEEAERYPRTELFSDLSHEEFMAVVEKMEAIDVSPDTVIISEGDMGDSIFVIASGDVKVFRLDERGNEIWISNLSEGEFFGEFGFFSEALRLASVKSVTDATLLELSKDDVDSIIKKHPGIKDILFEFYKRRVLDTLIAISPIFSPLNVEERRDLVASFSPKSFKKGEVVIKEKEIGDKMYFVRTGEVEVSTEKEGSVISLAKLGPGDFFGEVSVITEKPRTASVTALTDVNLVEVSKDEMHEEIRTHPEILEILNKYISMRVEDTIAAIMQYKNRKTESGLV
jgi:cAMP-dependent protein kinase regulator